VKLFFVAERLPVRRLPIQQRHGGLRGVRARGGPPGDPLLQYFERRRAVHDHDVGGVLTRDFNEGFTFAASQVGRIHDDALEALQAACGAFAQSLVRAGIELA
jgi:hypothetical protein